jgi:hypothetical protein
MFPINAAVGIVVHGYRYLQLQGVQNYKIVMSEQPLETDKLFNKGTGVLLCVRVRACVCVCVCVCVWCGCVCVWCGCVCVVYACPPPISTLLVT